MFRILFLQSSLSILCNFGHRFGGPVRCLRAIGNRTQNVDVSRLTYISQNSYNDWCNLYLGPSCGGDIVYTRRKEFT